MFRSLLLLLVAILAADLALAQQSAVKGVRMMRVRGNILNIEDSDRVKVAADDGVVYSVTLLGVDAPDENQSYYKKARKRLSELLDGKDVTVMLRTNERNESFATVYVGGDDIGLHLIREGFAWFSPLRAGAQNDTDQAQYKEAEAAARAAKLGLWGDKDPIAPWTFRGDKIDTTPAPGALESAPQTPRSEPIPGRAYILGPRGGCYYLNDQGIKVYVKDKGLCKKPE